MGWNSQYTGLIVVQEGAGYSGLFAYSGTPAAGNLVLSEAAEGGTDPFGNVYLPGSVSYTPESGFGFVACASINGRVQYYQAATEAGPWTWVASVGLLNDGSGNLNLFLAGQQGEPGVYVTPAGNLAAQSPGGGVESWHHFNLASGWSAGNDVGGNSYPPAYKLLPDGNVALRGELITPATGTVDGVTFGAVELGYAPAVNDASATVANNNGTQVGVVYIRPDKNVQLAGAFGNNANIRLDCTINVQGT